MTTIKSIEITKIKGINNKQFNLDLVPNKPNILVAPNGFGKSSFGIAFDSLKRDKIELDDKNHFEEKLANRPVLSLTVQDEVGLRTLTANDTQNEIKDEFDVFVINSQLISKATKMNAGGFTVVKSSLEIAPTVLVPTIPAKVEFDYSPSEQKTAFGNNGKILPNIKSVFSISSAFYEIEELITFSKFAQVKNSKNIDNVKADINAQSGKGDDIINWIETNKLDELRAIEELNSLAKILYNLDGIQTEVLSFLAAFQIIHLQQKMGANFKKAINYLYYLDDKAYYQKTIADFDTTRHTIKPREDRKHGLIVEWPKAHAMSNGQRDILSFVTLLMKAKRIFRKKNCILIIDEIFDYLDDANLVTFQYYITDMIEQMKAEERNFFPILLTHIDPLFFNHFCFNRHKIKVVYLKEVPQQANTNIIKLIKKREELSIKDNVDTFFFHFNPNHIDISNEFGALGLPTQWGNSENFHKSILKQVKKYLDGDSDYDPLAVCFGVRVKIESLIYTLITEPSNQQEFLSKHGTKKKLDYCERIGISVPEIYYLLGIIYNDRLHWREGLDIVKPVAIKLENLVIKSMIKQIFKP